MSNEQVDAEIKRIFATIKNEQTALAAIGELYELQANEDDRLRKGKILRACSRAIKLYNKM